MTPADWMVCKDPEQMLTFVQDRIKEGKLRLFACGCCRRIWELIDPPNRAIVEAAEDFARGRISWDELQSAADSVEGASQEAERLAQSDSRASARYETATAAWQCAALAAADAAWFVARCAVAAVADLRWPDPSSNEWKLAEQAERAAQADLLRALFRRSPSLRSDVRLSTAGRPG
jgi:hypothetical protein